MIKDTNKYNKTSARHLSIVVYVYVNINYIYNICAFKILQKPLYLISLQMSNFSNTKFKYKFVCLVIIITYFSIFKRILWICFKTNLVKLDLAEDFLKLKSI